MVRSRRRLWLLREGAFATAVLKGKRKFESQLVGRPRAAVLAVAFPTLVAVATVAGIVFLSY